MAEEKRKAGTNPVKAAWMRQFAPTIESAQRLNRDVDAAAERGQYARGIGLTAHGLFRTLGHAVNDFTTLPKYVAGKGVADFGAGMFGYTGAEKPVAAAASASGKDAYKKAASAFVASLPDYTGPKAQPTPPPPRGRMQQWAQEMGIRPGMTIGDLATLSEVMARTMPRPVKQEERIMGELYSKQSDYLNRIMQSPDYTQEEKLEYQQRFDDRWADILGASAMVQGLYSSPVEE